MIVRFGDTTQLDVEMYPCTLAGAFGDAFHRSVPGRGVFFYFVFHIILISTSFLAHNYNSILQ